MRLLLAGAVLFIAAFAWVLFQIAKAERERDEEKERRKWENSEITGLSRKPEDPKE